MNVIEIVDALIEDKNAVFYPLSYERITAGRVVEGEYSEFIPDDVAMPFSDLVWNNEMINLSIRTKIEGHIELPDNELGLPHEYPTHIYRTFTIIKDGDIHVDKLDFSCSGETLPKIIDAVDDYSLSGDMVTGTLDLTRVPIIDKVSIPPVEVFCGWIYARTVLHGIMKAAKHLIREERSEESAFLGEVGVANGVYNPPSRSIDSDYYMASTLRFYIRGCTSLPSVSKVEERIVEGKDLTTGMEIVYLGMSAVEGKTQKELEETMEDARNKMKALDRAINRVRIAIMVCDKWFVGVPRKSEGFLNEETVYKFGTKKVKV